MNFTSIYYNARIIIVSENVSIFCEKVKIYVVLRSQSFRSYHYHYYNFIIITLAVDFGGRHICETNTILSFTILSRTHNSHRRLILFSIEIFEIT